MDHAELAEQYLRQLTPFTPEAAASAAVGHALLALCECLEEISCLVAFPQVEE